MRSTLLSEGNNTDSHREGKRTYKRWLSDAAVAECYILPRQSQRRLTDSSTPPHEEQVDREVRTRYFGFAEPSRISRKHWSALLVGATGSKPRRLSTRVEPLRFPLR